MTAKFDVSTLNWVKGEIDASLEQARVALEAFVATPDDETQMRFCVMHLHQVHGTLQMVELYGASRAAGEMEQLATALQEKHVANVEHATEVLMRAVLQLPDYLEGLQTGHADNALLLLPLINEMRRMRGEQPLPEGDFFQPDLGVLPPELSVTYAVDVALLAQKARPYYQSCLLHILRGEDVRQSLRTVRALSDKLLATAVTPNLRQWFWVFGGFVDALAEQGQTIRTAAKRLLSNGDQLLRTLGEGGERAADEAMLSPLLISLLFHIAQARDESERVAELKDAFGLRVLTGEPVPVSLSGFNAELKKTLAGDVLEELAGVQDALDIFVRGSQREASDLLPLADTLGRLASTLSLMGQSSLHNALERQVAVIRGLQTSNGPASDDVLMGIASAVLAVDSALRDWGTLRPLEQADDMAGQLAEGDLSPEAAAEHQRVVRQVMKEARSNLLRVKDAVDSYVAAPADNAPLAPLPALLHETIGSLKLMSYTRVAQVLRATSLYISNDLARPPLPAADKLDMLADALTSVEYYLDAFVESRVHPAMVLEVAEQAVAKLGYPVDSLPEDDGVEPPATTSPAISVDRFGSDTVQEAEEIAITAPTVAPVSVTPKRMVRTEREPPVTAASLGLDEEIAEIFIEEATEEVGKIGDYLPRWQANIGDTDTLRDLRRSFHTLKGSGRLVGATVIGEFAWSFENMLNRVIDGTVEPSNAMFDLLEQGLEALPELIEEFRTGTPSNVEIGWLEDAATAMSEPGGLLAVSPPAATLSGAPAAVAADDASPAKIDPVLLEIYGNETEGHLAAIEHFVADCRNRRNCRVNEALIRALHTLQGSSRMAGVLAVADVSSQLEKFAKALHTAHTPVSNAGVNALEGCVALTRDTLAFLQGARAEMPEHTTLLRQAETLNHSAQGLAEGLEELPEGGLAQVPDDNSLHFPPQAVEGGPEPTVFEQFLPDAGADGDELFSLEVEELSGTESEHDTPPLEEILSSIALEELPPEPEAFDPLPAIEIEELNLGPQDSSAEIFLPESSAPVIPPPGPEEFDPLRAMEGQEAVTDIPPGQANLAPPSGSPLRSAAKIAPVTESRATVAETPEYDQELLDIFLEEGAEIIDSSEELLQAWREQPDDQTMVEALQRQLHTLKGGARMAGVMPVGDLSHTLESIFEDIVEGRLERSREMFDLVQLAHDRLVTMLDQVRGNMVVTPPDDLIARIQALAGGDAIAPKVEAAIEPPTPVLPQFLRKTGEILEACDVLLRAWGTGQDKSLLLRELNRRLRALKEQARDAGIGSVGELVQSAEYMLDAVADGHVPLSERMFALVRRTHGRLLAMLEQLRSGTAPIRDTVLSEAMDDLVAESRAAKFVPPPVAFEAAPPLQPVVIEDESELAPGDRRQGQRLQHDVVRVRADLLDNLVNFAGEVSIYRSRVEQQVGGVNYNLRDFSEILDRLHDQLRQFAIETEAQMQSRYEEVEGTAYEDFDPLEFDRFTHMQQLSRSAMESLNDLVEVQQSLRGNTRETETLLLQQARVTTELQEGLMHTRMMPLVEHAPRLRRIVRQTAAELGKEVELRFRGADVEMDRHMVERMLAPIEHLLRNAIAHGVEMPEDRRRAGKEPRGIITMAQVREGSEIVLRVIDDGAGINLERVRQKAIERELMKVDAGLSDKEIVHFILEAGFSTAESLTQVAGRGVGMDVVNSEIKQLGGLLEIDTRQGEGTTFTVRLPLTLSVSRALLVKAGDETYAIPMTSIQGIERLDPARLEELLALEHPTFTWLNREYQLLPLAATLGLPSAAAVSEGETEKRPLLFSHSGDHFVAWVADNLLGTYEIVVKSLGPQLSKLRGLSGATILGDGSVALILDLPLLARLGLAQRSSVVVEQAPVSVQPTIMVVDDSITVRKVTSRLLERNDLRPVTAKDGVDAIAQLEDVMPDVMLLDIEMPRMDGYELATHIRNTERLKHIPIIMITSRSGEKHRQRAMEIGVNVYMSKPYQESELLENIRHLMEKRSSV